MSEANKYERYESPQLKEWKKLNDEEQLIKVREVSKGYEEQLDVQKVHHQSIEVSLFMEKEKVYGFLVEYETFLRNQLGGFPIIVLLKDRADENRKRK